MIRFLSVNLDELPNTFFNADRMADFWGYVRWVMKFFMPLMMTMLAFLVAYGVTMMIIDIIPKKHNDKDDDDDDDVEVYRY